MVRCAFLRRFLRADLESRRFRSRAVASCLALSAAIAGVPLPAHGSATGSVVGTATRPESFENDAAGYSLTHPGSWDVREAGEISTLRSPSDAVVVSVGPGGSGDLQLEADRSAALIERTYRRVSFSRTRTLTIGSSRAREISGTATNDEDARIRFRVVNIEGLHRNWAIAAFATTGADDAEVAAIDGIVSSFRPPSEFAVREERSDISGVIRRPESPSTPVPASVWLALLLSALALLGAAAFWPIARRRRGLARGERPPSEPAHPDFVRVQLRGGRWIEGWRKADSPEGVIILDSQEAHDSEIGPSPDPKHLFIPKSWIVEIEPRPRGP